jgi:DNA polymerase-3 subunit delta'
MDIGTMKPPLSLDSFLGNARVVEILRRAVDLDRLPHALLLAGPDGVGKRTLALLLAQLLNCSSPRAGHSCGSCGSCRKIASGSHPDVRLIEPDGAFIKIEQVRQMIAEVAYQPFEARYRVVILDGAEQMRLEAANSLLKTLEEPPSRTIMILVTRSPYLLLTTIRSRARLLQFGGIPEDRIEAYLVEREGWDRARAHLAAELSLGSLGAALAFNAAAFDAVRAHALRFVSLLLAHGSFAEASQLAAGVTRDKEGFPVWLELVSTLLRDTFYVKTAPGRVCDQEILSEIKSLAERTPVSTVSSAIRAVNGLRISLQGNVNRQIAVEALFLSETGRSA